MAPATCEVAAIVSESMSQRSDKPGGDAGREDGDDGGDGGEDPGGVSL